MQQIADWLNKLGLEQYAQRFADNDIDPSVLRDLTDHDLEKIGVSLGHRRKILRAIAELDEPRPRSTPAPRTEAENRSLLLPPEEAWQWQREATAEQGNRIARVMMA